MGHLIFEVLDLPTNIEIVVDFGYSFTFCYLDGEKFNQNLFTYFFVTYGLVLEDVAVAGCCLETSSK